MDVIVLATLAGFAAAVATAAGALPTLVVERIPPRLQDGMLGFAAGVMLAASFFSLILPALEVAREMSGSVRAAATVAVLGVLLGAATIWLVNELVPHEHFFQGREGSDRVALRRIWLFVLAITIHNLPEGLSIGVAFGGGDLVNGASVAVGISLQDVPEGMAVAMALAAQSYSRRFAALVALLSGLVEPLGAFVGILAVTLVHPALPWGLAFAAGAMLYVISHEIIPETHRRGYQNAGTLGLMIGLAVMLWLDVTLG
ncbi:Zinc transporter ZupT [bacterium HR40]|nr:Zinc transporter ZupT [bacterium HR40]